MPGSFSPADTPGSQFWVIWAHQDHSLRGWNLIGCFVVSTLVLVDNAGCQVTLSCIPGFLPPGSDCGLIPVYPFPEDCISSPS